MVHTTALHTVALWSGTLQLDCGSVTKEPKPIYFGVAIFILRKTL